MEHIQGYWLFSRCIKTCVPLLTVTSAWIDTRSLVSMPSAWSFAGRHAPFARIPSTSDGVDLSGCGSKRDRFRMSLAVNLRCDPVHQTSEIRASPLTLKGFALWSAPQGSTGPKKNTGACSTIACVTGASVCRGVGSWATGPNTDLALYFRGEPPRAFRSGPFPDDR